MIGVGIYIVVGAFSEILWRAKAFRADWSEVGTTAQKHAARRLMAPCLDISALVCLSLDAVATSVWNTEKIVAMAPGETQTVSGFEVRFDGVKEIKGPNFTEKVGSFSVSQRW